jgi:hypothetical protein
MAGENGMKILDDLVVPLGNCALSPCGKLGTTPADNKAA